MADATYAPKVYKKSGGDTMVVASGGTLQVESGGTLQVDSGATFSVGDGTQAVGDFALARGSVVVGNASGVGSALNAKTSGKILVGDGTDLASVAVSGDASLSSAGAVTVTGVNGSKIASSNSTITLGSPSGTTQVATIQLKDGADAAIADVRSCLVYMATDAAGATPSATGANASVTVSTGAAVVVLTAKLNWQLVTDATGAAALTFDNNGGGGTYTDRVVLVLPTGEVVVSSALAVANA